MTIYGDIEHNFQLKAWRNTTTLQNESIHFQLKSLNF